MDRGKRCCRDVVPFLSIIAMNFTTVGLHTLFKAATNHGMSYHVFIVYAYGVAALLLLPSPFFSLRSRVLPPLSFSISCKIFLLGLIGMEKLAIRSSSSQAKIIGTIVSIAGAFVVTLYKGPAIPFYPPPSPSLDHPLRSPQSNWVIGGLFLTIEFILVPMWYILQAQIMKEYPAELTVVFFYNLNVSVLAAIVGIFTEPNTSAWIIKADIGLVSILCSGIFGSFLDNAVNTWVLKVRGPVYVAMFKPLSIVIAVVMGVTFLGDTLYLGSIIGATIISVGFYTVMWGKAKEDEDESGEIGDDPEFVSNPKVPLLQSYITQETQS